MPFKEDVEGFKRAVAKENLPLFSLCAVFHPRRGPWGEIKGFKR